MHALGGIIICNVFNKIQCLQKFFLFLSRFYIFNVFQFLFERFSIYGHNENKTVLSNLLILAVHWWLTLSDKKNPCCARAAATR